MTIADDAVIRRNERTAFRELAGGQGAVLLHLDTAHYHSTNEVGTLVWELLADSPTFSQLLDSLKQRLGAAPPELDQDIADFLRALEERGLVTIG